MQTSSGAWVSETWPYGALPSAVVDGSSVMYPGVLPGVDLRLTAAPGGVSEVLVVHDASAAANPQLTTLHLGVPDASVSVNTLAQVKAVVADGSSAQAAAPTWWDSSDVNAGPGGPGGDESPRPLGDASTGSGLTLNIGSALSGASPVFPVFIDPEWNYPTGTPYWFTDAAYPNQSYLNGNYADGIQAVGNGGGYKSDAFWQFSLTKVEHAHILSAVMNTTQLETGNCSPTSISVAVFGPHTAGFTWNQEWDNWGSAAWGAYLQTQDPNYGCPGVAAHSVGWTVTSAIAAKAAAGSSYIQLGLEPRYRTDDNSRRHYAQAASLTIGYNHPPNDPTSPLVNTPSRTCGTATDPAYVNNAAQPVVLQVTQTDPDSGQQVNDAFYIVSSPSLAAVLRVNSLQVKQGAVTATIPQGALPEGSYAWHARGGDMTDYSADFSAWCYLTVDDTPPPLPAVTTTTDAAVVGQSMGVTFSDTATDVFAYAYWWTDGGSNATADVPVIPFGIGSPGVCPTAAGPVRFFCPGSLAPSVAPIDRTSTLRVAVYDKAGNVNVDSNGDPTAAALPVDASANGSIRYAPDPNDSSAVPGHGWITDTLSPGVTAVPDSNPTLGSAQVDRDDVALASTVTIASGAKGDAMSFPGNQTVATHSSRQDVDTTRSFSVSAWLTPDDSSSTGVFTAISESGAVGSGFAVQVNKGSWSFCVQPQIAGAPAACATSAANTVQTGVPVFVTGIWDTVNQQVRLLTSTSVTAQATAALAPAGAAAVGPTVIGSDVSNSAVVHPWLGQVTDVSLFQGVVDDLQLSSLAAEFTP